MDSQETQLELKSRYEDIVSRVNKAALKSGRNPDDIKIIPVSKTHPAKILECAYKSGIKIFGENYVQELNDKYDILHDKGIKDIEWHYIGHLQTNKVRFIAPFVDYIHSVDSLKLATEISKRGEFAERTIKILVQINTSGELNKSGIEPDEATILISQIIDLPNIEISGLMTIGTFTDDEQIQRQEFSTLRNTLDEINSKIGCNFKHLSMGMTSDFEIAIDEGATMIRVGTAIFGTRTYKNFG